MHPEFKSKATLEFMLWQQGCSCLILPKPCTGGMLISRMQL